MKLAVGVGASYYPLEPFDYLDQRASSLTNSTKYSLFSPHFQRYLWFL
jgi:hypothetical protein